MLFLGDAVGRSVSMSRRQRRPHPHVTRLEETILGRMPPPGPELDLLVFPDRADRLLGALTAMGAWVSEFDAEGRMLYASPQVESLLGFSFSKYFYDFVYSVVTGHLLLFLKKSSFCKKKDQHLKDPLKNTNQRDLQFFMRIKIFLL